MSKSLKIVHLFFIFLCISIYTNAQDSLSLFQNFKNQYDSEREFKHQFYYNPASKLDYSFSSFSELYINSHQQKDKIYRQQKGSEENGFGVYTKSFQKLNNHKVIWGEASYEKFVMKNVKWNENLDYERITPYITSDSVGGNIDVERYHFLGGYAQKFNKLSLGAEIGYEAQLGSRSRDPRLKNTTSELNIKLGVGYTIYRKIDLDIFLEGEKYQQNGMVRFASKLGQPLVYQMTGLGYYNNMFSGGTSSLSTVHETYSYKTGGKLSHRNSKDFYVLGSFGGSKMKKSFMGTGNRYYYLSDLNNDFVELEGAKFFQFNQHRVGVKLNYNLIKSEGIEYGYSNNTQLISLLYKRVSYKRNDDLKSVSLLYSLHKEHYNLSISPYYRYQEVKEQRLFPYSGQKFEYNIFGLTADYVQELTKNQTISIQPFWDYKSVISSKNSLTEANNPSMNNWLIQDFNFLSSNITTIGATLRYNIKLEKLPTFFASGSFVQSKIQSKNNNYSSVSLGITF